MRAPEQALPAGLLLSWYGDDFTGAAAVMEVLTLSGLPAVLFFDTPTPALLNEFSGFRAIGIAGVARSKSPQWMEEHLPQVYRALARVSSPVVHYKVCSTLDSAPHVGSIGKAIDLAAPIFKSEWIPVFLAAPAIHRYQLFANLFATANGTAFRLDRHPSMRRHPVTPMTEADVRLHLERQTGQAIGLVDYLALTENRGAEQLESELVQGRRVVALDTIDGASLIAAGQLLWEQRGEQLFVVGSQGVEYALTAYWRSAGLLEVEPRAMRAAPVDRIAVASGSCSPVTAQQIDWAEAHGFEPIRLELDHIAEDRLWVAALAKATERAIRAVNAGRDPLVFTARGPDDPAIAVVRDAEERSRAMPESLNERIGHGLGLVLNSILKESRIRRVVLAGGDTSGRGAKALHIRALTLLASTMPGAGLFRAHTDEPHYADLEIALKGGQMGAVDYFGQIKNGGSTALQS